MTRREGFAWAAGFVDGEGHFRFRAQADKRRNNRRSGSTQMIVGQVERAHLETLQTCLMGFGNIQGPYTPQNGQPCSQYTIAKFEHVQAAACMMWPFLGDYRKQQIVKAFKAAKDFRSSKMGSENTVSLNSYRDNGSDGPFVLTTL
jgi:hypothetical protein